MANTPSGSGGSGGTGGSATGTATVTLDAVEQELSITVFSGPSGGGGSAGVGTSLSFGGGGDGRNSGDTSANARLTAGPSTTRQTATLTSAGATGGNGGNGVLMDIAQLGGSAGLAGRAGVASGSVVMRGSAATVRQTLTAGIAGGGTGRHGSGAGVPQSVNPDAVHPLNGEAVVDMETPADNAVVSATVNVSGGSGAGRLGVVGGGPLPSKAHLKASRIVASGANANIGFSGAVVGGGAFAWGAPPPGPGVVLPGNLSFGGRGAEPIVDGVELIAGVNGTIGGAFNITGGDGGGVSGSPIRAGRGADVVTKPGIFRATSAGGPINLQLQASSGGGGVNVGGVDGVGGQVRIVNALNANTPTGSVVLVQGATGGSRGGRAVSSLEHIGTTSGFLGVSTVAVGGGGSTSATLGSAQATTIVTSVGNQTAVEANATGRSSETALIGVDACAVAIASGPGSVTSTAVATGADAVVDGLASAFSRAEVTTPGTAALAKSRTAGTRGQSEAVAVALGDAVLPVSRVTARFKGEGIASGGQDGGTGAAAMDVNNFTADVGFASGNSGMRASAFDDADFSQRDIAVTQPFLVNPAVAAFFTNVPNAKHLVSCRAVQRPGSMVFTGGRIVRQTFSGTLELATNRSGGQLVLSGLGFTAQGGGFDSMRFIFRQNGAVLSERIFTTPAGAGAFFTNQVTTLADLAQAESRTVFSWEIITEASASTQLVDANFLLSATAPSGLAAILPGVAPRPRELHLSSFSVKLPPTVGIDLADLGSKRISGRIVSPEPFATVILESSADLGQLDSWSPMYVFTTDGTGETSFEDLPLGAQGELPSAFFRLKSR